jgi:hypothetical protein
MGIGVKGRRKITVQRSRSLDAREAGASYRSMQRSYIRLSRSVLRYENLFCGTTAERSSWSGLLPAPVETDTYATTYHRMPKKKPKSLCPSQSMF